MLHTNITSVHIIGPSFTYCMTRNFRLMNFHEFCVLHMKIKWNLWPSNHTVFLFSTNYIILFSSCLKVSAWGGYVFIINLIPLHVFVLLLMGRFSSRLLVSYTTFYILGLVMSMQVLCDSFTNNCAYLYLALCKPLLFSGINTCTCTSKLSIISLIF